MNTKKILVLSFLSISFFCTASDAPVSLVDSAVYKATLDGNTQWLKDLMAKHKAEPPFYGAAKHGTPAIATATCAQSPHWKISKPKRKQILERLILSGNVPNARTYLSHKVIKASDITLEHIAFAQERARHCPGGVYILQMLQQAHRMVPKKKKTTLSLGQQMKAPREFKKVTKPAEEKPTDSCTICLDDIEEKAFKGEIPEARKLSCKHPFHEKCILTWIEAQSKSTYHPPSCPVCRTKVFS